MDNPTRLTTKSKKQSELRERRKKLGCCAHCGKPKTDTTKTNCENCTLRIAALRQERRKKGICTYCKSPAIPNGRYCEKHYLAETERRKARAQRDAGILLEYTKAHKTRRAALGQCLHCKSTDLATKRLCSECSSKRAIASKRRHVKIRQAAIDGYGGKCACCGETTQQFLVIDHKYNDGAYERRMYRLSGHKLYYLVVKLNFPEKYQLLCYNCNNARAHYGRCPHQDKQ